jgi:transcriptional regulator with XRE-family HTH domain
MLGKNLLRLRKIKQYTQQQMADRLKIGRVTYTNYEKGNRVPDNETLIKLADLFGVSTDLLLGRRTFITEETKYYLDYCEVVKEAVDANLSPDDVRVLIQAAKMLLNRFAQ